MKQQRMHGDSPAGAMCDGSTDKHLYLLRGSLPTAQNFRKSLNESKYESNEIKNRNSESECTNNESKHQHNEAEQLSSESKYQNNQIECRKNEILQSPSTAKTQNGLYVSDCTMLLSLTCAEVTETLRKRFEQQQMYTWLGPVLIFVNPYQSLSFLHGESIKMRYYKSAQNLGNPHLFSVAEHAFRCAYGHPNLLAKSAVENQKHKNEIEKKEFTEDGFLPDETDMSEQSEEKVTLSNNGNDAVVPTHCDKVARSPYDVDLATEMPISSKRISQTIVVTGAIGSGKSEVSRHALNYLLWAADNEAKEALATQETEGVPPLNAISASTEGSGSTSLFSERSKIERGQDLMQNLKHAATILEAFGNARRIDQSDNSTRVATRITLVLNEKKKFLKNVISSANIQTYLLDKSRISKSKREEQNFHVFYALCDAAEDPRLAELGLQSPEKYKYLVYEENANSASGQKRTSKQNSKCTARMQEPYIQRSADSTIPPLDLMHSSTEETKVTNSTADSGKYRTPEYLRFSNICEAFHQLGVSQQLQQHIWELLSIILMLGNVELDFINDSEAWVQNDTTLEAIAKLLRIAPKCEEGKMYLYKSLTEQKILEETRKLPHRRSCENIHSFAKLLYDRLFAYIVQLINFKLNSTRTVEPSDTQSTPWQKNTKRNISVLDLYGFDSQPLKNSLEQLCANYAHEMMQEFLLEQFLQQEYTIYSSMGLQWPLMHRPKSETLSKIFNEHLPLGFRSNGDAATGRTSIFKLLYDAAVSPIAESKKDEWFSEQVNQLLHPRPLLVSKPQTVKKLQKCRRAGELPAAKVSASKDAILWDTRGQFRVQHLSGTVIYASQDFVAQSRDALTQEMAHLIEMSNFFEAFEDTEDSILTAAMEKEPHHKMQEGVKNPMVNSLKSLKSLLIHSANGAVPLHRSIGCAFAHSVNELISGLSNTQCWSIRCIRANDTQSPLVFRKEAVAREIISSGIQQMLNVLNYGFPYRNSIEGLLQSCTGFLEKWVVTNRAQDSYSNIEGLMKAIGMDLGEYQILGKRLFLRKTAAAKLRMALKKAEGEFNVVRPQQTTSRQRLKGVFLAAAFITLMRRNVLREKAAEVKSLRTQQSRIVLAQDRAAKKIQGLFRRSKQMAAARKIQQCFRAYKNHSTTFSCHLPCEQGSQAFTSTVDIHRNLLGSSGQVASHCRNSSTTSLETNYEGSEDKIEDIQTEFSESYESNDYSKELSFESFQNACNDMTKLEFSKDMPIPSDTMVNLPIEANRVMREDAYSNVFCGSSHQRQGNRVDGRWDKRVARAASMEQANAPPFPTQRTQTPALRPKSQRHRGRYNRWGRYRQKRNGGFRNVHQSTDYHSQHNPLPHPLDPVQPPMGAYNFVDPCRTTQSGSFPTDYPRRWEPKQDCLSDQRGHYQNHWGYTRREFKGRWHRRGKESPARHFGIFSDPMHASDALKIAQDEMKDKIPNQGEATRQQQLHVNKTFMDAYAANNLHVRAFNRYPPSVESHFGAP